MVAPFSVDTSSKGTAKVAMAIAQRSMPPFRSVDRVKLDGIEVGATNDQTGAEMVAAIDAQLGSTDWRSGGATTVSGSATVTLPSGAGVYEHAETVALTGCTGSMRVFATLAPTADTDENGAETIEVVALSATPGTDSVDILLSFRELTSGPIKINLLAL